LIERENVNEPLADDRRLSRRAGESNDVSAGRNAAETQIDTEFD
jgi:hypothetical protein